MKSLLVLHTRKARLFPRLIDMYFESMGGRCATRYWGAVDPDSALPQHDSMLLRFGGHGGSKRLLESLEEHHREHHCCIAAAPEINIVTSNKFTGVEAVADCVEVPSTRLIRSESEVLDLEYPMFFKPLYSSGGQNVHFVRNKSAAIIAARSLTYPFIAQEPVRFKELVRTVLIDGSITAISDRPLEGHFASMRQNPRAEQYRVDAELSEIVSKIADKLEAKILVTDFFHADGYTFNEISTACDLVSVGRINNIDYANLIAAFIAQQ